MPVTFPGNRLRVNDKEGILQQCGGSGGKCAMSRLAQTEGTDRVMALRYGVVDMGIREGGGGEGKKKIDRSYTGSSADYS